MGVSLNGGFPQQLLVFLLKMTILGCFGGTPIFGNTHIDIFVLDCDLVFRTPYIEWWTSSAMIRIDMFCFPAFK